MAAPARKAHLGEVTYAQLTSAINGTSMNSNGRGEYFLDTVPTDDLRDLRGLRGAVGEV